MKFEEYQKLTHQFAVYPEDKAFMYLTLGLVSEIGEVAGVIKKHIRGDEFDYKEKLKAELGDVAWYLAELGNAMQVTMDDGFFGFDNCKPEKQLLTELIETILYDTTTLLSTINYSTEIIYRMSMELSDVCIDFESIVKYFDFTVSEILQANIAKLSARKEANTIKGSGDNR